MQCSTKHRAALQTRVRRTCVEDSRERIVNRTRVRAHRLQCGRDVWKLPRIGVELLDAGQLDTDDVQITPTLQYVSRDERRRFKQQPLNGRKPVCSLRPTYQFRKLHSEVKLFAFLVANLCQFRVLWQTAILKVVRELMKAFARHAFTAKQNIGIWCVGF